MLPRAVDINPLVRFYWTGDEYVPIAFRRGDGPNIAETYWRPTDSNKDVVLIGIITDPLEPVNVKVPAIARNVHIGCPFFLSQQIDVKIGAPILNSSLVHGAARLDLFQTYEHKTSVILYHCGQRHYVMWDLSSHVTQVYECGAIAFYANEQSFITGFGFADLPVEHEYFPRVSYDTH